MDIRVFELPRRIDGPSVIEKKLNELETKARQGTRLDDVELNWMDSANTWMAVEWSKINAR